MWLIVVDVVSVLLQSGISGLNVLLSGCTAVMLSEKKIRKDKEIVLELETQIKGRTTQRIVLQCLVLLTVMTAVYGMSYAGLLDISPIRQQDVKVEAMA